MSGEVNVDRAFVRLAEGLVHYRHAGARTADTLPVYLAHSGPGSSRGLAPLVAAMGANRFTIAPDMLGNGDSDPPARRDTDIAYYADCVVRVMDALQIDKIDYYGTHTGAMIGLQLGIAHPDRVSHLVLDGLMVIDEADRPDLLANYAPEMKPDDHGGYLAWVYQFCRDMMIFYPYYKKDGDHLTGRGAPDMEFMHPMIVDVMKALETYHCAYRAAFSYDVPAAIAQVTHPVMLSCQSWDPLRHDLPRVSEMMPSAESMLYPLGATPAQIATHICAFLDKPS